MIGSMKESVKLLVVKAGAAAAATEIADAAIVDMQGHRSAAFVCLMGSGIKATAKVALSVVQGDTADLSDGVESAALVQHTAASDGDGNGKLLVLDVVNPCKRYMRVKSVFGQDPFEPVRFSDVRQILAQQADVPAVLAILYNGGALPAQMGDMLDGAVLAQ